MKLHDGLNYREWQKRNKEKFDRLSNPQKKQCRDKGYCNVGWEKVRNSWQIISNIDNVINLFDHHLRSHNLIGALDISILEAENAIRFAEISKKNLNDKLNDFNEITDNFLSNHPIL